MKTFSSQGLQLSAGQKRRQQFEKQASVAFLNPILAQQTAEAIAAAAKVERKPLPKQWELVYTTRGTPCVMDAFGFGGYEGKQVEVLGTWDKYGNFYPDRP